VTQPFKLQSLLIFKCPPLRGDHLDDIAYFPGWMLFEYLVSPLRMIEVYDNSYLRVWRRVSKQFAAADLMSNKYLHLNLCPAFW
jgi:hypothetical protein